MYISEIYGNLKHFMPYHYIALFDKHIGGEALPVEGRKLCLYF